MVTCYDNNGEESWYSNVLSVSPLSVPLISAIDSLDFGTVFIGDVMGSPLVVHKNGAAVLNITNITFTTLQFDTEIETLTIPSSSQSIIPITFTPTEFGLVTATITIYSDAFNMSNLEVALLGFGDLPPNPIMLSAEDVPDDQGGQIRVSFKRSKYDGIDTTLQIESYTVWRHLDNSMWDAVGMFNAVQDSIYNYVAPTLCDSTTDSICWSTYKVSAHTDDADLFFWSDSISGYSVDNIAPSVPTGLMATATEENIQLTWDVSLDEDFQYFLLEKSITADFAEYESFESTDTVYFDFEYEMDQMYFYRLAVADYTGNIGDYSETVEIAVLAIDGNLIPEVFALHQNYPNPFNPTTTLRYDLPEDANVNIMIYDLMGREVRSLINTDQTVGFKSVTWDATNDFGQPVSAGMYLYRISAGSFHSVKKMVLLK